VDLTKILLKNFNRDNIFTITNSVDLLQFKGDPCPLISKKLYIFYQLNNIEYCNSFDEQNGYLINDIKYDFTNLNFKNIKNWVNFKNNFEFNDILKNISIHLKYNKLANNFMETLNYNNKINIIYLNMEKENIHLWSKKNHIKKELFISMLESKYILLITNYIDKKDNTIILGIDNFNNNKVISFLKNNQYNFYLPNNKLNKEENFLVNLSIGQNCNNILIAPINCSTFCYLLSNRINSLINIISFSLNNLNEKELYIKNN